MGIEFLLLLLLGLLVIAPVLAISAVVRVYQLRRQLGPKQPGNITARLAALEQQVGELNRKLKESLTGATPAKETIETPPAPEVVKEKKEAEKTAPSPPVAEASPPPKPAITPPQPKEEVSAGLDLESLIAGRWLNRVGIIAVLVGVAWFLKLAFDNNWVGPTGRVAIGLLAGALLLVYSNWLLNRGWRYFSNSMTGLGAGILYLSVYAAFHYYHLIPQSVAFLGMIAITGAMLAIALGRDSQAVAFLALMGGFLTPGMVSTGVDAQVVLFSYLALLNGAVLVIAHKRNWRSLELVGFFWTLLYFAGWYGSFYESAKLLRTASFATLFFAEFSALPLLHTRRGEKLSGQHVALVLLNASWFLLALHDMLYQSHRWMLTLAVLGLAAAYLGAVRLLPTEEKDGDISTTRILFAGLALTFVTLAIPIRLEGKWITIAWAIEGAVLIWSGFRIRFPLLRTAGLILFAIVAFRLFNPMEAGRFLLNPRFAVFAISVLCFAAAVFFARERQEELSDGERDAFAAAGLGITFYSLLGLSLEVWDSLGRLPADGAVNPALAQQLGLSLLWVVFATVLVFLGVRNSAPALRWQGLALFGLVAAKVFLFDSSFLTRAYRILSFLALGVLLLVVSFFYQKRLAADREEKTS